MPLNCASTRWSRAGVSPGASLVPSVVPPPWCHRDVMRWDWLRIFVALLQIELSHAGTGPSRCARPGCMAAGKMAYIQPMTDSPNSFREVRIVLDGIRTEISYLKWIIGALGTAGFVVAGYSLNENIQSGRVLARIEQKIDSMDKRLPQQASIMAPVTAPRAPGRMKTADEDAAAPVATQPQQFRPATATPPTVASDPANRVPSAVGIVPPRPPAAATR
jgi:hypothetical protein